VKHIAVLLTAYLVVQAAAWADTTELEQRRLSVHELMGDHAVALLLPAPQRTRSNDVSWPYRQHNHLYYLTRATHPGTHLMLVNNGRQRGQILFAKLADPAYEVWEGKLPSVEQLQARSGIETVYPEQEFDPVLQRLLNGRNTDPDGGRYDGPDFPGLFQQLVENEVEIWLDLDRYRRLDSDGRPTAEQQLAAKLRERFPELRIRNLGPELEAIRYRKSEAELALLQRAIDITGEAQLAAMGRALDASHEYQVEAAIEFTFRNLGACCAAFPSIVAGGENATILHYGENNAPLNKGDLLLMDIGAELDYYAADITRTIPVSGRFSEDQRAIYELVLAASREAIAAAKPGIGFRQLDAVAKRRLGAGLMELGLIIEDVDEQVESYFLHGLGHSLGLDVHDAFDYELELDEAMVVTIEPGIYVRPRDVVEADWYSGLEETQKAGVDAALERFGGIGVRIEDDILITRRGAKNLSAEIPVSVEDIETIMAPMPQSAVPSD
jgi:Xaa-Pro aminopeptidase